MNNTLLIDLGRVWNIKQKKKEAAACSDNIIYH